jgi:ribonuclease VapC
MLVLDTSAIVAILLREPGELQLEQALNQASSVLVGTPTVLEAAMILTSRLSRDPRPVLYKLLVRLRAKTVTFDGAHFEAAFEAFQRFGKGRHPARLNFGDCMSYAVAELAGLPLLYTGDDFSKTDIEAA